MLEDFLSQPAIQSILAVQIPLVFAALAAIILLVWVAISNRRSTVKSSSVRDEAFSDEMLRLKRRISDLESKLARANGDRDRAKRKSRQ